MATAGLSKNEIVKYLEDNDEKYVSLDLTHITSTFSSTDFTDLATPLAENTVVQEIKMPNMGMLNAAAILFANIIETNSTIVSVDLGYNKIGPEGMSALAKALAVNKSITECKLHRQEKDMGSTVEAEIAKIYDTNTTLQRLYITLHDRRCNQANTAGEVRNKEIAARIKAGKEWMDLDPSKRDEWAAKKKAEADQKKAEEELANAPISSKVESTGGPYTLKQLTAKKEFRPDDVDSKALETYLSDDEFEAVFKMNKDAFKQLAKWKQSNMKKKLYLH